MKKIIYTEHLKIRIGLRQIPKGLPKEIYLTPDERYYDSSTRYRIALKKMEYIGRNRDIIVCYEEAEDKVDIITIHPLKTYQKLQRVKSGRWKKI